jgi:predicted ABC-type transport system involved in lysophospholipase L1 biosynthesis ATPase subunit
MHGAHRPVQLALEGVAKAYGAEETRTVVLESVDLLVHEEEKVSLVGPSGSGKSTLLALIAGLIRPDAGRISIGGVATHGLDDAGRAALRAQQVGVVLQSDNLIPFLTAVENVELATGFTGTKGRRDRARELLAVLGVDHRRDHLPRQLSGGEAQRVSIAVALANEPTLLLADEVVGQLDSATAARVVDVLFEADLALVFVTHDESLAARGERQLRLVDGTVVEQ